MHRYLIKEQFIPVTKMIAESKLRRRKVQFTCSVSSIQNCEPFLSFSSVLLPDMNEIVATSMVAMVTFFQRFFLYNGINFQFALFASCFSFVETNRNEFIDST